MFRGTRFGSIVFAAVAIAGCGPAMAACPDDGAVAALAEDILAGTPSAALQVETIADGLCAQDKLVAVLAGKWGAPIGYKAGLTSKPAQEHFGVSEPVRGVLYANMMLQNGAKVSAKWAALPRYEADLIVVVGDDAINTATTPAEVLAHLSAVHPFIELPDLVMANPAELNGPVITSINVGARLGVLGDPIAVENTEAFLAALSDMTVTVTSQDGNELVKAKGAAVLGHPLNSVLWLMSNGITLTKGDLVSVGSIGPLLKPEPGVTATVTYDGLPGTPSVSVTFE